MSANSRKVSPLAWVPTVYFAMGLPFIIVNMVATLMFRGLGIDDARITLWTSLIILPWSLKPFWSPLMEMFRTKKFWVVATQLVSGLGLALVALSLPLPNFFPYAIALMAVVAFSGATHDIATDGVYITELSKDLQAKFIGWQGAFYNIAKVFAMGGLVYLAGALKDHVGIVQAWMTVMGLCGGILFLLILSRNVIYNVVFSHYIMPFFIRFLCFGNLIFRFPISSLQLFSERRRRVSHPWLL